MGKTTSCLVGSRFTVRGSRFNLELLNPEPEPEPVELRSIDAFDRSASARWLVASARRWCSVMPPTASGSPIVGYLIAGLLVGPYTPGFVADRHMAEQLAEVGIILLMFGVGLQFHIEELVAVWRVAVPGGDCAERCRHWPGHGRRTHSAGRRRRGWSSGSASVASTVVLIRVLSDNRDLHTRAGHIAVGWLVVEDLLTVLVLVMMPAIYGGRTGDSSVAASLGLAALKVAILTALILVGGRRVVPWLLTRIAATRSRELFTLTVLALALCISVASAQFFGVSMALGAFLAGLVVGRSEFSVRAASEALPMRDAFAVLFFVSVGMLLEPGFVIKAPVLISPPSPWSSSASRSWPWHSCFCGATRRAWRSGSRSPWRRSESSRSSSRPRARCWV